MTTIVSKNPVTFRAIIPRPLQINSMDAAIRDAAIQAAKDMGKDLDKVIETWKADKPVIMTEAKLVPAGMAPSTKAHSSYTASAWLKDDGSRGYKKFMYLELGTERRFAVMTPGFIPKTRAGQLKSWVGKGKMLVINKNINHGKGLPGIKKREFIKALRERWVKPTMFKARMAAALRKARVVSGHAM